MWIVLESEELRRAIRGLPSEILKRYEKWKDVIRISGVQGLRQIRGFRDEKLQGKLKEYRSSRLGDKYRVIYLVKGDQFLVKVITITPHEYRRVK